MAAAMVFGSSLGVCATTVSDVKQEQTETKKKLQEVNQSITAIENKRKQVQSEIKNLNADLVEAMLTLELLNADLEAKKEEIADAQAEYEEYKALEEKQYQLMKYRIQYLYENSETSYFSMLLSANSITEFLNRVDFATNIYKSDDEQIAKYEATKELVAEKKAALEEEEAELEEVQEAQQIYKNQLDREISAAKSKVANFETELANAQTKAKEYQDTIKKQNAEIQKLLEEEEKKQQTAGAKPPAAGNSTGNAGNQPTNNTGDTNTNNTDKNTATPTPEEKPSAPVSGNNLGAQIAAYAVQFVGNPYVPGGTSLTNGADCSGFTWAVHKHFGISIPRVSVDQSRGGKAVSISNVQPGDIIYYGHHVGIYIGNGKIVHASTQKTGIKISNYTYRTPICVRRYW